MNPQSNTTWRTIGVFKCQHCHGEIVMEPARRYVIVDSDAVDWMLVCTKCNEASRLRALLHDGHVILSIGAMPRVATESTSQEPTPVEPTPVEPASTESAPTEPEPTKPKNPINLRFERGQKALIEIANLVLDRSRNGLAFGTRNVILGRLANVYGARVWAVDVANPSVARILNAHGGKVTLANVWQEMGVIQYRTHIKSRPFYSRIVQVSLTPGTRSQCLLFHPEALRNARAAATAPTIPNDNGLFA